MKEKTSNFPRSSLILGACAGLLFGLLLRAFAMFPPLNLTLMVMSFGFVFFGPLVIGAITIGMAKGEDLKWPTITLWPWLPVVLGLLLTLAFGWEGRICIAMYVPAGLALASIGGWIGWFLRRRKNSKTLLVSLAMFPLFSQLVESQLPLPLKYEEVHSEIHISASAENVWREIKSVRTIGEQELPNSWVHKIGFPRPLDAVVDHENLGGVRTARFERGLTFEERIDQ